MFRLELSQATCLRKAKALARPYFYAGSLESFLVAYEINYLFSHVLTNLLLYYQGDKSSFNENHTPDVPRKNMNLLRPGKEGRGILYTRL